MSEASTYDVARAFLDSMHVTSWPRDSWQIREERGQDAAAVWITNLVDDINAIRNIVNVSTRDITLDQAAEEWRRLKEGR